MSSPKDLKQHHDDDNDDDDVDDFDDDEYFDEDEDENEILSDLSDLFEEDSHLLQLNVDTRELTLDDVPFDRDLKYINVAGGSGQVDEKGIRHRHTRGGVTTGKLLVLNEGNESTARRRDRGGTRARRSRKGRPVRMINGTTNVTAAAAVDGADISKDSSRRGMLFDGSLSPERRRRQGDDGEQRRRREIGQGDNNVIIRRGTADGDGRNRNPAETDIIDSPYYGEGNENGKGVGRRGEGDQRRRRRERGTRGKGRGWVGDDGYGDDKGGGENASTQGRRSRRQQQKQQEEQEQKLWTPSVKLMTRPPAADKNIATANCINVITNSSLVSVHSDEKAVVVTTTAMPSSSSSLKEVIRQRLNERPHSIRPVHKLTQPRATNTTDNHISSPPSLPLPSSSSVTTAVSSSLLPPSPPAVFNPLYNKQQQSGGHTDFATGGIRSNRGSSTNVNGNQQQSKPSLYPMQKANMQQEGKQQHHQQQSPCIAQQQQQAQGNKFGSSHQSLSSSHHLPTSKQQQPQQYSTHKYHPSQTQPFQQQQQHVYGQTGSTAAGYSNGYNNNSSSIHQSYFQKQHQQQYNGYSTQQQPPLLSSTYSNQSPNMTTSKAITGTTNSTSSNAIILMDYTDPNQQLRVTAPEFAPSFLRTAAATKTVAVTSSQSQPNPLAPEFKPTTTLSVVASGQSGKHNSGGGGYVI